MDIQPARILLSLDQQGETNVPVRANITGTLPKGYEVESAVCRPATVRVVGPRQRLDMLDAVSTEPIDLEGRLRSFQLRVPLETPGAGWQARMDPGFVTVDVTIVERSATRTLEGVPVRVMGGAGQRLDVSPWPDRVKVTLAGHDANLTALDGRAVFAYIDCEALTAAGSYDLPVRVHVPGGLGVQKVEPAAVKAEVHSL